MSNMRDVPVLKAVAEVIKDHVGKAFAVLRGEIDGIRQQIKELPQPAIGPQGPEGPVGAKGLDGASGVQGDVGPAGKDGAAGRDGTDGKDGIQGIAGKDGQKGADGLNGKAGEKGEAGHDGKDGLQGPAGIDGMAGKDGRDGIDGKDGAPGINGKDGRDGINGKDGADGINGKDADPLDTKAIIDAVTKSVLSQIPAPIPGKDGQDGSSVDLNAVRVLIASEVTKAVSAIPKPPAGRDGRDGRQGDAGRDALDIEIVREIDESASYQRNVFAKHRNGFWHAYRTTDPVVDKNYEAAGWDCLVAGPWAEVSSLAPDQRTVVRSLEMSDGKLITSSFTVPTVIDKGTWKSGIDYEQGDAATMAGSLWICQLTTQDRPGTSNAWRLAVKRGSDGKDLRPQEDRPLNGRHGPLEASR